MDRIARITLLSVMCQFQVWSAAMMACGCSQGLGLSYRGADCQISSMLPCSKVTPRSGLVLCYFMQLEVGSG